MIKTVSFAPPRASGSRSAAKNPAKVAAPRAASERAASGSSLKVAPQTSLSLGFDEPEIAAPVASPRIVTPRAKTAAQSAPNAMATNEAAPVAQSARGDSPVGAPSGAPKAKRARVTKDLAAQYGENEAKRPETAPVVEAETPKKRLSKAEREARRELIKPDEGLLQRLARATSFALPKTKSEPRGKGWKFECGRCGQTSYFQTPGALCACGTIALKE